MIVAWEPNWMRFLASWFSEDFGSNRLRGSKLSLF